MQADECFKLKCYVFLFRVLLICLSGKFCLLKGLNFLKFTFYKLLHSCQSSGSIRGEGKKERAGGCYAVLSSGDGYCPHEHSVSQPKPHIGRGDDFQAQSLRSYLHLITAREGENISSLGAWLLVHLPCSSE